MEKDNEFLGTEPVGRLLWRLAIPTITAQVINMLYNVVDRVYIGHMGAEGDMALTGVGVAMPVILFISAFAALISSGGAPRASIFMGRGDMRSAERTMGGCFTAQIAVSLALTAVLLIWNRPLLLTFGASENTIGYAADYMSVYALGTLFVEVTLGMNAFITAQGFAKTGMLTVLIGAVCNIALDPLFIFAFHMGVRGAALATVLSQAVSAVWVTWFLARGKSILRLNRDSLKLRPRLIAPCVALGVAPFVMQASESVITVCFNASLLKYGSDVAVGSMTILYSVMQFAMMPLQGLAQGAQPITSYNFGAKNAPRVREVFRRLLTVSLLYSTALWALVMAFPRTFVTMFNSDPGLVDYASRALRIYCAVLFLFGAQIACQMTFVSLGKAAISAVVAVVRKFVLLLPLIYLMPALMADKATAVYLAEPIADFLAVSFTVTSFAIVFRRAMKSIE